MWRERRRGAPLGRKLAALIIVLGVILSVSALAVSYWIFSQFITEYYSRLGTNLTRTMGSQLDSEQLEHYFESGEMDEDYMVIQR